MLPLLLLFSLAHEVASHRIAVIGGGISGAFTSRYVTDFDKDCELEALTVFDPFPLGEYLTKDTATSESWQGSRVATLKLDDDLIVELGASLISDQFDSIKEMALAGNLALDQPHTAEEDLKEGFVIHNGNGRIALNMADLTTFGKQLSLLQRYNIDILLIYHAVVQEIQKLHLLQAHLEEKKHYFHQSPMEMWESVGLDHLVQTSWDQYCDSLWIPQGLPWWRKFLYHGQGSLRQEVLASLNLVHYNQNNSQVNALSGISSLSAALEVSFHVRGGNNQLVKTAFQQAQENHRSNCPHKPSVVSHDRQHISTVVGSLEGFDLFNEHGSLIGHYDTVVLAAPIPMASIHFLVKSHIDESVLQPMPLGGLVQNKDETSIQSDHEGHDQLPRPFPPRVTRPFVPVVTTIVRNATLQTAYFSIHSKHVPREIYMTPMGKMAEQNITSIVQVSAEKGVFKLSSSQSLSQQLLRSIFGTAVEVEYEKTWGGPHGGIAPDYQGQGEPVNFLIYDGATGFHGQTKSGSIYFPNAMELTLASLETSALGAKAVAKLIARRLDWLEPARDEFGMGEEL